MRQLKHLSLLLGLLLLGPSTYAQSVRFQSQAISSRGAGIANATVAVCTQPSNTNTQPCSPLATLATSTSTTSGGANPLTADSFGNFFFYAAPGRYTVQIYGPAVSGQFVIPDVEISSTSGGAPIFCRNINQVRCVDNANSAAWSGTDACAWITSAQADIATTGGTVDARGLQGTQTACAGTLTIGGLNNKPITLLLSGAVLTVQNTITVNGASLIQGAGSNSHGPFPTRIIAGASFPINTTLMQFDNTQINFDIRLMNLELDCSNITGCRGLDTGQLQDGGLIQDVWITSYGAGGGAIIGGCINTGSAAPTENWIAQEVTCIRSTTAAVTGGDISLNAVADHFTLTNTGCGTATGSTSNACIQCNNCNLVGTSLHEENATDGVLFTGNAAAGGTSSISELDCLNNVTNCLHISSNFNGNVVVNAIKKNSATNAWKNDVATAGITGTCTDENAGWYQFSFNNLSTHNSCSAAGMGTAPGNLFSSPGFQVPAGSGFILTDNTASHVQKVGVGPNVTGNDQVGFFSYTAGRDVFHCQLLSPFACVATGGLNTPLANATALQIFNTTTTCTTAASVGATCTTAAITLPVAEADTSYRVTCVAKPALTAVPVVIATTNSSATQFTITIAALTAVAASAASYDCVAGHN